MCSIHTVVKRDGLPVHAITQMNLENIMLNLKSQTKKAIYCIFHSYVTYTVAKSMQTESILEWLLGARETGEWE